MNIYDFMSQSPYLTYLIIALFVYLILEVTKVIRNNNPPENQRKTDNLINYYKTKMDSSHKKWEAAQENDKPIDAAKHMQDYLNYKLMYDNKINES